MRKLNLIVVFSKNLDKVLFYIRAKEPYKGLIPHIIRQIKIYLENGTEIDKY